ncbi:uncharacterized protein ARMOST_08168 [Armillaria ostoyae]|uniref:Uncharacterized protein n=1 Tax=Armillaria ostoyae TaxID=47428 RepID=A0A284R7W2_ARMOS|nr:uncharacterized protein ARMOST_08168 [Armillaria ostoyae]
MPDSDMFPKEIRDNYTPVLTSPPPSTMGTRVLQFIQAADSADAQGHSLREQGARLPYAVYRCPSMASPPSSSRVLLCAARVLSDRRTKTHVFAPVLLDVPSLSAASHSESMGTLPFIVFSLRRTRVCVDTDQKSSTRRDNRISRLICFAFYTADRWSSKEHASTSRFHVCPFADDRSSTADLPSASLASRCPRINPIHPFKTNTLTSASPSGDSLRESSASFGGGVGGLLSSVAIANLPILGPTRSPTMNRPPAPLLTSRASPPFAPSSLRARQEFPELPPSQKDEGGLLLKRETISPPPRTASNTA